MVRQEYHILRIIENVVDEGDEHGSMNIGQERKGDTKLFKSNIAVIPV